MDHRSFRDMLLFSIGFAISRNRDLLRRMLREHITDGPREQLAKRVVEHPGVVGLSDRRSSADYHEAPRLARPRVDPRLAFSALSCSSSHCKPCSASLRFVAAARISLGLGGGVELAFAFGEFLLQALATHAGDGSTPVQCS